MVVCTIPVWLRISILWVAFLLMGGEAFGQNPWYGADSAEKVSGTLVTPITIGQTITSGSPFKIAVSTGAGAKFAKIPKPFILTVDVPAPTSTTFIEEFVCSAVSNDTLTLVARAPAVGHNLSAKTWAAGSYVGYRLTAEQLLQLQHRIDSLTLNSGTVSSITFQSPLTGGTITTSGTVTLPMATTSQSGYISSAAYTAFNNKQAALIASSPLSVSGANISISQANTSTSGYLSSTDWNTFDGKYTLPDTTGLTGQVLTVLAAGSVGWSAAGSGTVSSINVSGGSSGLTFSGGPVTSTGTITLSSGQLVVANGGTGASTAAQARVNLLPDTTAKTNKYLRVAAGGGIVWDTAVGSGGGGSGTVTSVDMTVPSFLSISGNPITTSGTLALSLSGTALPYSSGGTGQIAWTKGDLLYASATNTLSKLPVGTTGQVLTVAAGLPSWAADAGGTVTSVAASGPSGIMTWSSAVTTSGTLTATLSSQTQNMVLASPDGSSGTPSFRSLVTGDIPSLDVAQITSGSFSVARGGTGRSTLTANSLLIGNGTSAITLLAAGGSNTVLTGTTTPSYQTLATDATLVGNGLGTSFGIDPTHANTWTGTQTINKANIQTTYTDGLPLTNATASDVSHTVQQSPSISLTSHVWNTTSTATDSIETWRVTNVPVSGASTTSSLLFDNGNTGAGFTNVASLSDAGTFTTTAFSGSGAALTSLNASNISSGTLSIARIADSSVTAAKIATSAVSLTKQVSGVLPVANGGTNSSTALSGSSIMVSNGTSVIQGSAGTTTTVLHGNASGAPTYGGVVNADLTAGSFTNITGVGTLTAGTWNATTVDVAHGGSGSTTLLANRLLLGRGTAAPISIQDDTIANGSQLMMGKVLLSNGVSGDPYFGLYSLGVAMSANLDTVRNRSGGTLGTLTRVAHNQAIVGATTPILAAYQADATSGAGVYYTGIIDSVTRALGTVSFNTHRLDSPSASYVNNSGNSVPYVTGIASSNGTAYSNQFAVQSMTGTPTVFDTTIGDSYIHASSIVIVTHEKGAHAASGVTYPNYIAGQAEGTLTYRLKRLTPSNSSSLTATEGVRVNYGTFVSTPDNKIIAGSVQVTSSSAGQSDVLDTISCPYATASSIILTTAKADANTPSSGTPDNMVLNASVEPPANWPAGKIILHLAQVAPSSNLLNSGKGGTINYVVINPSATVSTQPNWTFAGAPVAITNTTNQLVLGSTTTTTISATAPAASAVDTIPDVGTSANFVMSAGTQTVGGNKTLSGNTNFTGTASFGSSATYNAAVIVTPGAPITTNSTLLATVPAATIDATVGNVTVTLPASPPAGMVIRIARIDNSANTVTVQNNTGQTVLGGNVTMAGNSMKTFWFSATNTWSVQ